MIRKRLGNNKIVVCVGIALFVFAILFIWAVIVQQYCYGLAESLTYEEAATKAEPTVEERANGVEYDSRFYQIISRCEPKYFPLWNLTNFR